jgi:hypothetical protein
LDIAELKQMGITKKGTNAYKLANRCESWFVVCSTELQYYC